jgi:hypothetical protein
MPDQFSPGGKLTRSSRRVRVTLFALAALALVVGAAAFFVAVQANSRNAATAVDDARSAAAAAKSAAAQAQAAAAQARGAAAQAEAVRTELCTFLNIIWHNGDGDAHESQEAQHLYVLYKCGAP